MDCKYIAVRLAHADTLSPKTHVVHYFLLTGQ